MTWIKIGSILLALPEHVNRYIFKACYSIFYVTKLNLTYLLKEKMKFLKTLENLLARSLFCFVLFLFFTTLHFLG